MSGKPRAEKGTAGAGPPLTPKESAALAAHKREARWVIGVLVFVVVTASVLRSIAITPEGHREDRLFELTYQTDFQPTTPDTTIRIALPRDTGRAHVIDQRLWHPNLRVEAMSPKRGKSTELRGTVKSTDFTKVSATFSILLTTDPERWSAPAMPEPTPEQRAEYLAASEQIQVDDPVVGETLAALSADPKSKRELLARIVEFSEGVGVAVDGSGADAVTALKERQASVVGRARAMIALCRAAKIPARPVVGFVLESNPDPRPHTWVEVFVDDAWESYDPDQGFKPSGAPLPGTYIPVRYDDVEIARVNDEPLHLHYRITEEPVTSAHMGGGGHRWIDVAFLDRLPLSTRHTLTFLLLMPMGTIVTTFLRNVVGVRTFGTFSPTLLAMALLYADWHTAAFIFPIVIVIGLMGRAMLPDLKLVQAPRLSIVFTMVAALTALSISIMDVFDMLPPGHIVLLPMVVLTMMVDRGYTIADENGPAVAIKRFIWTMINAAAVYFLLGWTEAGETLVQYPELMLLVIVVLVLIGQYDRRRLTDFQAFRWMAEPKRETAGFRPPDYEGESYCDAGSGADAAAAPTDGASPANT